MLPLGEPHVASVTEEVRFIPAGWVIEAVADAEHPEASVAVNV